MQSVLKIGFALAKKGGIGIGGQVSARGAVHIYGTVDSSQWGEAFTGWRSQTIVSSLMSGRGGSHE